MTDPHQGGASPQDIEDAPQWSVSAEGRSSLCTTVTRIIIHANVTVVGNLCVTPAPLNPLESPQMT